MNKGSKIILVAPCYYNYHEVIVKSLLDQGSDVDFFEDKNSGLSYTISTKSNFLLSRYKKKYRNNFLAMLDAKSYNYMIVIGGKTLDADFWEYIRANYTFKMILYQWDSLKNFDYRKMIPFFDKVKTFDKVDATKLNIEYLPLFYKTHELTEKEDIDLLFVGIWHSDRIPILDKIAAFAEAKNLKFTFKVYYPKYVYYYMIYIKKSLKKSKFFIFKPLPFKEVISLYKRSRCIIDINHPDQSGLTMRTIETVGEGKKLITTNHYIISEPFYNDKMIQVIDREDIIIKENFFSAFEKYKNIEELEIDNWIKRLMN